MKNKLYEKLLLCAENTTTDPEKIGTETTEHKYKLMIKQHWETGISYLCITQTKDFRKYRGSGTRWIKLLKKYPGPIHTSLLFSTDDKDALSAVATYYSDLFDVVNNPNFANCVPEYGYVGNQGNLNMWWENATEEQKKETRAKIRITNINTCLERYGTTDVLHIAREKGKLHLDELGLTSYMKIPEVLEKFKISWKKSLMDSYGVDHNMKIPGVADKVAVSRKSTLLERYGVEYPLQIGNNGLVAKTKREKTMIEKYGVPNISMIPEVAEARGIKISETLTKREFVKCSYCVFESKNVKFHENLCKHNPNRIESKKNKCQHCDTYATPANIKRWHNDNCKKKGIK